MSGYVEVEVDGKVYEAYYHDVGGVITVYGDLSDDNKTVKEFTTTDPNNPKSIARMLLRRLVKRGVVEERSD